MGETRLVLCQVLVVSIDPVHTSVKELMTD
jgi:hypothetical protein